jgi:2-polyprenyl-6-hydroxyphenyl methylase/3-demethylubiquinone-9 3-methyltransferase
MALGHPALDAFSPLPLKERLFVRARLATAPLVDLASRVKGERVLDVGCGHGVLCALLTHQQPSREVVGIDPDPRKVDWARASVGRFKGTDFHVTTVEQLAPLEAASFDAITVADVLYLLPEDEHPGFLAACHQLLKRGGTLWLKEAEDDGGWRTAKALAQERLMVRFLGRTRSSGGLGFSPREKMARVIEAAGFRVERVEALSKYSTTPHVIFEATCV